MSSAGFKLTIVGHSLGAGSAAILTVMLQNAGVENVACYAFASPNCMNLDLAQHCAKADLVTSVVFRDDIVARFSPAALAKLLIQLQGFDLEAALKEVSPSLPFYPSFSHF